MFEGLLYVAAGLDVADGNDGQPAADGFVNMRENRLAAVFRLGNRAGNMALGNMQLIQLQRGELVYEVQRIAEGNARRPLLARRQAIADDKIFGSHFPDCV